MRVLVSIEERAVPPYSSSHATFSEVASVLLFSAERTAEVSAYSSIWSGGAESWPPVPPGFNADYRERSHYGMGTQTQL